MVRSVSCTTRKPRGPEVDGKDYHFVAREEFARRLARGDFLEHAVVHGHWYGTLRRTVEQALRKRRSVLLVIDVQGAAQIRERARRLPAGNAIRRGWVDLFVMPPGLGVLRERLRRRGEDTEATIQRRLRNARREMRRAKEFKYAIVNDNLDVATAELEMILKHESQAKA